MTFDPRVIELLAQWEECLELGAPPTPEELCADCPDLLPQVREGLATMQRMGPRLAAVGPSDPTADGPPGPQPSTLSGPARDAARPAGPIPGYEVLEELGRGATGVVYKARQHHPDRLVALKMVLAGGFAGPSTLERFHAEAGAIARLRHPNIVQVYATGEHEGRAFFALEYCDGGTLAHKLAGAPLAPRAAAELLRTLAGAVQAAHGAGVVHRDVKPSNVLLLADGTPKVADFGLAKQAGSDLTATEAVMGTPSYMAPEQAAGRSRDAGPAADVYSLGAILYECLTGRPPFKAATPFDTALQARDQDPVPVRQLQSKVPRDVETICLKCLEKDPGRRYTTAGELADDLGRWLGGEPIKARPVSAAVRAAKWARRRPAAAAALAATVVGVLAVLGVSVEYSAQLREANGQLTFALDESRQARDAATANAAAAAAAADKAMLEEERARAAERQARAEERKAQSALEFLAGMFEAADPFQMSGATGVVPRLRGEELSAADLLTRGAEELDRRADLDADTRATLLQRIASSLLALGYRTEARGLLTRVRRDLEMRRGPDHPSLADTFHSLAWLEHFSGDYDAARGHYENALRLQALAPPGKDTDYRFTAIRIQFAALLGDLEDFPEARRQAKLALEGRKNLVAPDDTRLAETYFGSAIVALQGEDYLTAAAHVQAAIGIFEKRADPVARALGLCQQGILAGVQQNDWVTAERNLKECLALTQQHLKRKNVFTLLVLAQLGLAQRESNRLPEAAATMLEALQTAGELQVLTHPKVAVLIGNLWPVLIELKQPDVARKVIGDWLATHRELNPTALPYADALTVAGDVYVALGDRQTGGRRLEQAQDIYCRRPDPAPRRALIANQQSLGRWYAREKNWVEAARAFREVFIRARQWYPDRREPDFLAEAAAAWAYTEFRQGNYPIELGEALEIALQDATPQAGTAASAGWVRVGLRLAEFHRHAGAVGQAVVLVRSVAARAHRPGDLADAAEQLARCAAAAPAADRDGLYNEAVRTIDRASRLGYRDADAVEKSDAFRPVAGRPAFQEALERMRARVEP